MISNNKVDITSIISDVEEALKKLKEYERKSATESTISERDWLWIPHGGENFFYVVVRNGDVDVAGYTWNSHFSDSSERNYHIADYNIFKTKELAEERKHLSRLQRKWAFILDHLGRQEEDASEEKTIYAAPYYSYMSRSLEVGMYGMARSLHRSQYANTVDMCKQAMKIMGDDIYSLLGVTKP